jgi:hypothetical protein
MLAFLTEFFSGLSHLFAVGTVTYFLETDAKYVLGGVEHLVKALVNAMPEAELTHAIIHEQLIDRSGASVFRIMTGPAMLD